MQKNNIEINLEEDVIKYYIMPSLQHVSMSSIIIALWSHADIKCQIVKLYAKYEERGYRCKDKYKLFENIVDKVLDKLSQLAVPSRLKKILSNIVHPIGQEIYDWIYYQDAYIFNNVYFGCYNLQPIAINYIDCLVWTPRGVIDYEETAKKFEEEKLSEANKHHIACAYCFEDKMEIIASKMIERNNTRVVLNFELQAIVYYWTAHKTGDFSALEEEVYRYNRKNTIFSINECVFTVLIENCRNKTAIKHIWYKLSNEERSRLIVTAIRTTRNNDIRCFLLSQISKKQQKEVFAAFSAFKDTSNMLFRLLDDYRWEQYFLITIHHIFNIMSSSDYLDILEGVLNRMEVKRKDIEAQNQYKAIFQELWRCSPRHLKEYVFGQENHNRGARIFLQLFCLKNIDVVELILADINYVQKKEIIFSYYGICTCMNLFKKSEWDLLEILIKSTLSSAEDVESFKKKLINEQKKDIAMHLILSKDENKVNRFLRWACKSGSEIREFKSKLAYSNVFFDIVKFIVNSNQEDFEGLKCFFSWCTSDDAEGLVKLKRERLQLCFNEIICQLIEKEKYDFLTQILDWFFVNDQKQISEFKEQFIESYMIV